MLDALVSAVIGFVSGILSGAFGIGGGIITTPAIRLVLGAPALIAVGTPLPVIVPGSITGAISYLRAGEADLRAGLWLGGAGALTAIGGAMLATRAGGTVVLLGTAALILYAAIDTVMQIRRPPVVVERDAEGVYPAAPVGPLIAIGLLSGLYSGFFGLGGGFVLVPLLTRWIRLPVKRAIGTSLVTVALLAIPGTITHALLGNIDWRIAAGLAIGVVPGAALGARITLGAADRRVRYGFASLLAVVGVWLACSEILAAMR